MRETRKSSRERKQRASSLRNKRQRPHSPSLKGWAWGHPVEFIIIDEMTIRGEIERGNSGRKTNHKIERESSKEREKRK